MFEFKLPDLGEAAIGPVGLHRHRVGRDARQSDQDLRGVARRFVGDEMRIEHHAVAGAQPIDAAPDREYLGVAVGARGERLHGKLVGGKLSGDDREREDQGREKGGAGGQLPAPKRDDGGFGHFGNAGGEI